MNALLITVIIILVLIVLIIAGVLLDIFIGIKVKHPVQPEGIAACGRNQLRYFTSGRELFDDMYQSMDAAKHHIHLSFFIFNVDDVGSKWIELLKKKAEEGVEVRLLVDSLNGHDLRRQLWDLNKSGVEVGFSGRVRFPFTFYYLNRRNHRKIAVIDGKIGYFGGFNVSREYIGNDSERGPWHDNHLKVIGESVRYLQEQFLDDWRFAGENTADEREHYLPKDSVQGPSELTLLATSGKQIETVFAEKLAAAKQSIVIGSPYFIPTRRLMNVLKDRLDSGVELKIILPMKKDHPFVKPASYRYLLPLVSSGAKVYHFYQGFYHSKLFVVDQRICFLGTANFDMRSFYWNDELSGFYEDPVLARKVLEQVNKEIKEASVKIDLEKIESRSVFDKMKTVWSSWLSFFL